MRISDYPLVFAVITFLGLAIMAWIGKWLRKRRPPMPQTVREDFNLVQAATLTLLGLIIGFTFSMAVSRYDQRKNLEEEEANAIGTAFVRADLLPTTDAAKVRALLLRYLDQRIVFYTTRDDEELRQTNAQIARLQAELWSAVQVPAVAQPTPLAALTLAGMNDVLNSQGYTQAAWWNRIPRSAWFLLFAIAMCSNVMVGYGGTSQRDGKVLMLILPLVVAIAFLLVADIDSPRSGLIRLSPQNLESLSESLRAKQ